MAGVERSGGPALRRTERRRRCTSCVEQKQNSVEETVGRKEGGRETGGRSVRARCRKCGLSGRRAGGEGVMAAGVALACAAAAAGRFRCSSGLAMIAHSPLLSPPLLWQSLAGLRPSLLPSLDFEGHPFGRLFELDVPDCIPCCVRLRFHCLISSESAHPNRACLLQTWFCLVEDGENKKRRESRSALCVLCYNAGVLHLGYYSWSWARLLSVVFICSARFARSLTRESRHTTRAVKPHFLTRTQS